MAIDPITGQFQSPFALGRQGLPTMAPIQRRYDNAPGTMVSRAIGRGVDMMQRNVGSAVEGIGNVTGIGAIADYGAGVVRRNDAEIARSAAMESEGGALGFVTSLLGENAPQLAASVGLPLIGAAVGSVLGPKGTVGGFVKGMTVARGLAAGTAASGALNYAMLAGEMRETQKAENESRGLGPVVDEGRAFGAAVPAAALETLSGALQARIANKAFRASNDAFFSRETATRAVRAGAQGALFEAPTEAGQQAIVRAQADQSLTDREGLTELALAGLSGAILGGTVGSGGSIVGSAFKRDAQVANVTNDDMAAATDAALQPNQMLALPAPAAQQQLALPAPDPVLGIAGPDQPLLLEGPQRQLPPGQTNMPPADAGEAAQAPQSLADLAPEDGAQRPLQTVPDLQILSGIQALESKIVAGQASVAEQNMLAPLRQEAALRELEVSPVSEEGTPALMQLPKQDLRKALRTLDRRAKAEGLGPEDVQMYRAVSAEIARRDAPAEPQPNAQPSLFDLTPEQQSVATVRAAAREMGLPTGSKFYKGLKAENIDELYDAVLDGVAKAEAGQVDLKRDGNLDRSLAGIASQMGIGRDLDAEIAEMARQRDATRFPSRAQVETEEGREAFAQAQVMRQAYDDNISELRAKQQLLQEAVGRREAKQAAQQADVQRRIEEEAFVGSARDAAPMEQAIPETVTPERVALAPTSVAPEGALGANLQAALIARQRNPEADAEAVLQQDTAPTTVTGRKQLPQGRVEVSMSRGEPIRLQRRDGGWYDGDTLVSTDLQTAIKAVQMRRNAEAGFLASVRPAGAKDAFAGMDSSARAGKVRTAVGKAMQGWSAPYQVYVVRNIDDLPATVRARVDAGGAGGAAGITTENGTVVLFADNITSPDEAVATLFHEVLGHAGLRRMFTADRAKAITDLYKSSPALRDMFETWKYSVDPAAMEAVYSKYPLHAQIEEAISTFAEAGPVKATFLQKMAKVVADMARRLGFNVQIGKAELNAILAESHRRAMSDANPDAADLAASDRIAVQPTAQLNPTPQEVLDAAGTYGETGLAASSLRLAVQAVRNVPDTPQGDEIVVARLGKVAEQAAVKMRARLSGDVAETIRSAAVYFQSLGHLRQEYGGLFPMITATGKRISAMTLFEDARQVRAAIQQIYARLGNQPTTDFGNMVPADQRDTTTLMAATSLQIDPSKPLDSHTHLTPQERLDRRKEYAEIVQARDRLAKRGKLKVYNDMRAINEAVNFQQQALDIYDVVRSTPDVRKNIPAAARNPILAFSEAHDVQSNPAAVRQFWKSQMDTLLSQTEAFVQNQRRRTQSAAEGARIETLLSTLTEQVTRSNRQIAAMDQYPYFHLARFGKYTAAFSLNTINGPDGKKRADPRAVAAVSEALAELGFDNVELSENANGASVFLRTEDIAGATAVVQMANDMIARGFVDGTRPPTFGEVEPMAMLPENARRTLDAMIAEIENSHAPLPTDDAETVEAKQRYVNRVKADLQAAFLARLPDRSAAKVMARRNFRAGYDKNMVRGFAQRMQVASISTATRLANDMSSEALKEMSTAVSAARRGDPNLWKMSTVTRELMRREEVRPETMASNFLDTLRAVNHNYYLAMNPGYWLTQVVQLQTNLWPELVKSGVSYREAFGAMTGAFPTAMKIVKATIAVAKEQGFMDHGADATVTSDVLKTIQLSDDPATDADLKKFVLRMYNRGVIDIGSATRSLGREAEGKSEGKADFVMRWAGSGSYYLEVLTRLVSALSARDIAMKQGKDADAVADYAVGVVNESMMNYTEGNRGRAFGKQGVIGEATPLATAFMTFQFLMLEKYSREIGTAFIDGAKTPQEKAAARRWLGSHMASMTVLAGSLGLPFVTVVARVIDAAGDLFGDDEAPFDVKTGYRNFLADTFGQDVAEVLSRGLPRAIGFDLSGRVGAQDMLPFSRLLADRREWNEALKDFAFNSFGSSLGMAESMLKGGEMMADGQFLSGMREALPVGLKNPLNAIRMSDAGITDTRGNLLPVDASASAIIYQALGLTPSAKAEYSEANFAQAMRRGVLSREATKIRKSAVLAVQTGDAEGLADALDQAREFDANADPAFAILPTLATTIQQAQSRQALARGAGTQLNVRAIDQQGMQLGRFANY